VLNVNIVLEVRIAIYCNKKGACQLVLPIYEVQKCHC